ncbi:MAG: hypothetical protein DRJ09_06590 [Bacteroidetes bacterium]|nr:MAG: hypothetical protein DRJ09_06590 [Bacteroidota bacterium]
MAIKKNDANTLSLDVNLYYFNKKIVIKNKEKTELILTVYNLTGQMIIKQPLKPDYNEVILDSKGIYLIKIIDTTGRSIIRKFFIK